MEALKSTRRPSGCNATSVRLSSFRCLIGGATALLLVSLSLAGAVTNEPPSARAAEKTRHVVFGADYDYPPFEWLDKNGRPQGFNVDLINAVGKVMSYSVEVRLGPWPQIRRALEEQGTVDVSDMFLTEEQARTAAFSAPFWQVHDEIFVRRGTRNINMLDELAGWEVLCQEGSTAADLLRRAVPNAKLILVASEPEALRRLALGQHDCAVVMSMVGRYAIQQIDLRNLTMTGPPLWPRDYCLVTARNRPELLAGLNEGLAILKQTGRFDEIYDKWFADVLPRKPWLNRFLTLLPWMGAGLAAVVVAAAAWIWVLRHTVLQRTHELRQSEQRLRLTVGAANVGLWDWNLQSNAIWLSPEWKRQIGFEEHEFPNQFEEWQNRVHPGDLGRILATTKAYHEKPWPDYGVEFRLRHKDGSYRWILSKASLITDAQGKPIRMLGSHLDITERKRAEEILQESETRHRFLFEHNPMPMLIYERGTLQILAVNEAFLQHYGYRPAEVMALRLTDLYPEEEKAKIADLIPHLHGHAKLGEWHHRKHDGSFITNVVFSDDLVYQGRNARVAVLTDITERKRVEEALQKSEQQVRLIMENLADLVAVLDLDGRRLYNSPSYQGILGDTARLRGSSSFDQVHPEDRARVEQVFQETVRTGVGQRLEYRMMDQHGQSRHIESQGSVIRDAHGRVSQVVVVSRDVTERKEAERALRESEQKYRELVMLANSIILRWSRDGRITFLNEFGQRFFGYTEAEIRGRHVVGTIVPASESGGRNLPSLMDQICANPAAFEQNINENMRRNGEHVWISWTNRVVLDERGQVNEILSIGVDITARKRVEEELRAAQASLEERILVRTTELAEARDRAEEADRIKSAFLAAMSHELRTPLNSIIGFTGIVLQGLAGPLNPEQTKQLGMVRSSARHLLELINDVLDLSKIEAGQLKVRAEPFDLPAAIERVTNSLKPLAEKKGLTLSAAVSASLGRMVSDRRRLEQVLLNLLNNAIKFTEHGQVVLTVEALADYRPSPDAPPQPAVRLRVTDTGMGIKPDDLASLFQPFRQIDAGLARQHEGTGLGLAICRRLVTLMGGEISAASQWLRGSEFTVTLPLTKVSDL